MRETKCFFITGTDTNIGKTLAACSLLQAAIRIGYRAVGYKPVASGSKVTDKGIRNADALALMANSNVELEYHQVNPFAFIEPTAPHIASNDQSNLIDLEVLSAGLRSLGVCANWIVVEGAGGWFTPLGNNVLYSDWVISEGLSVILVVGIKLGCINHALLTEAVIRQSGLFLAGWIASHPEKSNNRSQDYIKAIASRLDSPLLGVLPWINEVKQAPLASYINLSLL
ncbi:ATP-dependent dethiobiotin synthetase BioD [Candidatus Erwinia haradaeae]|uniref:ATP-dependent dethiobiotin synthetase BioD n=2 Tax=Candidatus Erwinia haradaeae TaxID=1922217 RepID=A0A451DDF8_9GAMM|nr:ATP-dependent dethiobiotin synthetase BioD [Candidatus Erwinia haradaeae]